MPQGTIKQPLGYIPIMVKSKLCNLYNLSPQELIQHHEEEEVTGILWVRKICILHEHYRRPASLYRTWAFIFYFKFDLLFSLNVPWLWWFRMASWKICSHNCLWIQGPVWWCCLQFHYTTSQLLTGSWGYVAVSRPLWRQRFGEQALKDTFSFLVVFCSFFLISPVACQLWGIEYRITYCCIFCSQKDWANYERKFTMAYYCCPPGMPLVPSFIVLLATEMFFV